MQNQQLVLQTLRLQLLLLQPQLLLVLELLLHNLPLLHLLLLQAGGLAGAVAAAYAIGEVLLSIC